MFVYWGNADCGKSTVLRYAEINNIPINHGWRRYTITVIYPTVHELGTTPKGNTWWDMEHNRKCFHQRKDTKGLTMVNHVFKKLWWVNYQRTGGYAATDTNQGVYREEKPDDSPELEKYLAKEYVGTHIYYELLDGHSFDADLSNTLDPVLPSSNKNIVDQVDEIMHDVGLSVVPLRHYRYYNTFDEIAWSVKFWKKQINIIPYKTNLVESFTSKLNILPALATWGPDQNDILYRDIDPFEIYKVDKQKIWEFLDGFIWFNNELERTFQNNNIPYQMFDLDNDDYKDVFGWEKYINNKQSPTNSSTLGRKMQSHKKMLKTEKDWKRWHMLEDIAKEYIMDRGL